ncbi:conserved hypothetical protein [Leishmania major strain Friedlin]|uniref:Uncharacterized protein n=1 Tax=Leishmania major TaxID=5664 RepID=Q4QCG4_LEIMA|nr:conserved hypothetical protein [Leishmania major strain Friedlin]CAG9573329.1 hypothetical_protein_-_conserved [Leishmania major strain Friedlin]CAJ04057.1 conserved hypothetical protein [Leishmania major strain Friedlin]|eukprot:XP_001682984.1 conserved hypothetical protein [Leishmania major strain Friedlin]
MAKKRNARNASVSADATDSGAAPANGGLRPVFAASTRTATAEEVLHAALEQLDSIAQEAHVYTQQLKAAELNGAAAEATSPPFKRARDDPASGETRLAASTAAKGSRLDVFAAMSALQYQALCAAVAACGLQLLPSLEEILKRVALAVLTPWLSTPEAWETLAMLCTTYRAGAAHALTELLESLLREPGVLLLDAPQLVPAWYAEAVVHVLPSAMASNAATAALGGLLTLAEDQQLREESAESVQQAVHIHTERTARKLRALVDMLYAAGGYVPTATLQQMALRHAMEVVEGGVLPCYLSEQEYSEAFNTASTFPGTAAAAASSSSFVGAAATAGDSTSAAVLRWSVPAAWHAVSLQLLEAFLFTCRPGLPAQLLVTATRAINVLAARLHRGVPLLSTSQDPNSTADPNQDRSKKATSVALPLLPATVAVGAAVVRLGHVLQLLRHPVVLPPLQPAQLVVEKAKRRTFVSVEPAAAPVTSAPAAPAAPPAETVAAPSARVTTTPPPQQQPQPVVPTVAAPAVAPAPTAALPRTPQQQPVKPAPPPQPPAVVDSPDDDIPDIVMDD